ncbi:hypothetical protein RHMOL_Rhmol06G0313200 [Rhododendron molle]|uniref:Uncharacterized protein n=1 Tax=Rhododendron molle TaxID=49168 RepID=A0ACC0NJD4_RHOML|nr:hypothetical protein RHMOL_Rhmol06G0313200 [Rhododendron molle]
MMMMILLLLLLCFLNCWEDDSIDIEPLLGRSSFRANLRFSYHRENPNHDDDVQVLYSYQKRYFRHCDEFLSQNEELRNFLAHILVDAGISESGAESILDEFMSLAHSMLNDPKNVDRKVLPIAVDIQIRSEAWAIARERVHREFREELARGLRCNLANLDIGNDADADLCGNPGRTITPQGREPREPLKAENQETERYPIYLPSLSFRNMDAAAAAAAAMFSYKCWEDDSIDTEPFRGRSGVRSGVRALLRFSYHRDNPNHDDQVLYSYQRQYFMLRDDLLSQNEEERNVLAILLVDALISESAAESIVNEIMSLAHSMLNDPNNVDRKVLPIAVDIQIRSEARAIDRQRSRREFREGLYRSFREERARERSHPEFRDREFADDQMARATRDSMQVVKFVPATKSSIEALERVTIFDNNSCLQVEACRICLETLPIGAEVTRMPCSHIFHGNCIVRWLESSNLCPLCRFAMPH